MSQLIYLDTNIYIDYFEGRVDNLRPLGEFAFNVIRKAIGCEFNILISELVKDEIEFNGYINQLNELKKELEKNNKIINVLICEEDRKMAKSMFRVYNTSYNDILHFVIAKKNKAELFVTRNIKDFPSINNYPDLVFPENL